MGGRTTRISCSLDLAGGCSRRRSAEPIWPRASCSKLCFRAEYAADLPSWNRLIRQKRVDRPALVGMQGKALSREASEELAAIVQLLSRGGREDSSGVFSVARVVDFAAEIIAFLRGITRGDGRLANNSVAALEVSIRRPPATNPDCRCNSSGYIIQTDEAGARQSVV